MIASNEIPSKNAILVNNNLDSTLALCECISEWQEENDDASCVKKFEWGEISSKMKSRGIFISDIDCCKVWKYIAYGRTIKSEDVLESVSDDDEAYFQPLTAMKRFRRDGDVKTTPDGTNSVLNHYGPGPNLMSVRRQFKRVKVWVSMMLFQLLYPFVFPVFGS
jgi:hypothetical protein